MTAAAPPDAEAPRHGMPKEVNCRSWPPEGPASALWGKVPPTEENNDKGDCVGELQHPSVFATPPSWLLRLSVGNLSVLKVPPAVIVTADLLVLSGSSSAARQEQKEGEEDFPADLPCPAAAVASLWRRLKELGWTVFAADAACVAGESLACMRPARVVRVRLTCWPSRIDWTDPGLQGRRSPPCVADLPALFSSLSEALILAEGDGVCSDIDGDTEC